MKHAPRRSLAAVSLAALLLAGCASDDSSTKSGSDGEKHAEFSAITVPSYNFDIPPKDLVARLQQVLPTLDVPVEKVQGGTIITGYKEYPGDWHIARRWQDRTRYRITVSADFDEPTAKSHLEVVGETQTRASSQSPWYTWAEAQKPERAAELAQTLHSRLTNNAKG